MVVGSALVSAEADAKVDNLELVLWLERTEVPTVALLVAQGLQQVVVSVASPVPAPMALILEELGQEVVAPEAVVAAIEEELPHFLYLRCGAAAAVPLAQLVATLAVRLAVR